MAEIRRTVIKRSKRNVLSRHLVAKGDKEKIATWRVELEKMIRDFNVRSIVTVRRLLTPDSQTALAINTNVTVTETHAIVTRLERNAGSAEVMLSEIHRTVVGGQGGNSSRNVLVSDTRFIHRRMTTHRGID